MESRSLTNQKQSGFILISLLLPAVNLILTGFAAYLSVTGSEVGNLPLYLSGSFLLWLVVILSVQRSFKATIGYVLLFVAWDFILTNQISLDFNSAVLSSYGFICQRLVLFVLITACVFRLFPQFPPFITNIILWIALYTYPTADAYVSAYNTVVPGSIIHSVFLIPLYETVAVLIFSLLAFNAYVNRCIIQKPLGNVSMFNFCFSLVVLSIILFAGAVFYFTEGSFMAELYTANGLIIILVALMSSAVIAVAISSAFNSYQVYIEKAMSRDAILADDLSSCIGIAIRHDDRLIQLGNQHIEQIQELQHSEELAQQKFAAAQAKADSWHRLNEAFVEVGNQSPIGQLIVAIDGTIIDANKKFTTLENIPASTNTRGEEFIILNNGNAWSKEIWKILDDLFDPKDGIKRTKSYKTYSLPVSGRYLEIDVHLGEHFGKIERTRKKSNLLLGVVVIIQEKLDIRQLQAAGFGKNRQYLAEKLALISCVESAEDLGAIKEALGQQRKLVQGARTQDNYAQLKEAIGSASAHFNKVFKKISPLFQYDGQDESNIKQYELKSILKSTIGYVSYLSRLEAEIPIQSSGQVEYSNSITVTLPEKALNSFLNDFVQLVKSMLEMNPKLEVFLDVEDLKAGELDFMPTEASGKFARITLKHEGKSITETALSNSYSAIFNSDKAMGELEVAAILLANHIQELGGFTTLHNMSRKETIFSLYIPTNYAQQAVHEKENTIDYARKKKITGTIRICNALIIGKEHRKNKTIKRMLISLGAGVAIVGRDVLDESSDVLDFSGQGFDELLKVEQSVSDEHKKDGAVFASLRKINLVIISYDDESEIDDTFIKTVYEKFPESKVVVMAINEAQAEKIKSESQEENLFIQTKPLTLDDLKTFIQK